ncbi:urease accessory protein UreF [Tepidiforma sp.]|uniref:urease accessory protein UreF n=1 Tax=Tepidiforma sp. TaxID=2682230 RepID=UPI002ADE5445|nr:urease accessory UreF family protein [Tepidiforma sp.]
MNPFASPVASRPGALESLLRAFYLADSALPVGGYAYSHGLETLVHQAAVASPDDVGQLLALYIRQPLERQQFPALLAALRAPDHAALPRIDVRLDASISPAPEREAGRALGRRLVQLGPILTPGFESTAYARSVAADEAPGQHAVAMGVLARQLAVPPPVALAAFGHAAIVTLTGAAIRLGVIGPAAAAGLIASAGPDLEAAIHRALDVPPPRRFGAFSPTLEIASARHPTLPFRMFAA